MGAISMGLGNAASAPSTGKTSLIVTGLTDGAAHPGDRLGAHLSNGIKIETHAWGSTPGGADYGTQPTLTVPVVAAGRTLHVTVDTKKHQFTALVTVHDTPVVLTSVVSDRNAIVVESLGPRIEPALTPSAGTDAITVEID